MFTIGDRIRYFRRKKLLTQADLAEMTGIHPVSIRKYETNKMQPQPAQIDKIAKALRINSCAISGSNSQITHLDTIGDMMGLLILWHKSGILRIDGDRDEDNHLIPESVHLVPSPVLKKHLTLISDKKEEAIPLDSLTLELPDDAYINLLRWEGAYSGLLRMKEKYGDSKEEAIQRTLVEMSEDVEMIETELQGNVKPLK